MVIFLEEILAAPALAGIANLIQILVLIWAIRALEAIRKDTSDLHRWHDVPDPNHMGSYQWWGLGINDVLRLVRELVENGLWYREEIKKIRDTQKQILERMDQE